MHADKKAKKEVTGIFRVPLVSCSLWFCSYCFEICVYLRASAASLVFQLLNYQISRLPDLY